MQDQFPSDDLIFPSERGAMIAPATFRKKLYRLGKQSGFKYLLNTHSLRHSCVTNLLRKNFSSLEVQEYVGHKSVTTTEAYAHTSVEAFRRFWTR